MLVYFRLSTIVNADRIVCMDQGTIVEQGTHEELMKAKGINLKSIQGILFNIYMLKLTKKTSRFLLQISDNWK